MTGPALALDAATAVAALTATAIVLFLAAMWTGRWPVWLLGLLACAAAVLTAFLYRDPPRSTPLGADLVVAPADGRILAIDSLDDDYLGGAARRIRIRGGFLDLRILRSPVDGVVDYARDDDAHRVGLSTGLARVLVDADGRRPVVRVTEGELLEQAQRVGVLRAGGELAVLIPAGLQLVVHPGSRVRGGESILARAPGSR